jgi:peroxiredoxin
VYTYYMVLLESLNIEMGAQIHDFDLKGVDDRNYSLADFADAKLLVIVFMCNHCPYVQAIWSRLVKLQEKFRDRGVQFVGINSNINPDYAEDSPEKMKEYAKEYEMNFPYLADTLQNTARVYMAQCTPDIFVYDDGRKLAYHGRIDDNWKDESAVTKHELDEALTKILVGEKVDEQKPAMGCSIKWKGI